MWVEDTPDKKLIVRFGELGGEIETSPGYLDNLSLPLAWQPAGAPLPEQPALTLDILPTRIAGEFRVYLRGKPLPAAKVIVHRTDLETELAADVEGRFRFTPPSPRLVLPICNHKESINGFAAGVAYDVTSHNTALSWRQP